MVSQKGYGAKLLAYKDLVLIMQKCNLTPARQEDSAAEINALCVQAEAANNAIAAATQTYNTNNQLRTKIVRTDALSVLKTLPTIRKYVDALYDKNSIEAKQVASIIERLRSKPTTTIPATADAEERSISNNELGYGSITKNFTDLVTYLSGFPNYNPAIPHITITALQAKVVEINTLNTNVTDSLTSLRLARGTRNNVFPELHTRALRIKALIAATYGTKSEEYKSVKNLNL